MSLHDIFPPACKAPVMVRLSPSRITCLSPRSWRAWIPHAKASSTTWSGSWTSICWAHALRSVVLLSRIATPILASWEWRCTYPSKFSFTFLEGGEVQVWGWGLGPLRFILREWLRFHSCIANRAFLRIVAGFSGASRNRYLLRAFHIYHEMVIPRHWE